VYLEKPTKIPRVSSNTIKRRYKIKQKLSMEFHSRLHGSYSKNKVATQEPHTTKQKTNWMNTPSQEERSSLVM